MSWDTIAVNYDDSRGNFGERSTCSAQTGYCEETLDELWDGTRDHFSLCFNRGAWRRRQREEWRSKHYFYVFLMYIHIYPAKDNCVDILRTQKLPKITYNFLFKKIIPLARRWNVSIDHIRWDDR